MIPTKRYQFRHPEGMAVADQDQGGIPMAVPTYSLGGHHQPVHFLLGQVFPAAHIIIDFRRDPRISSNWVMGHVRGNKAQVIQELHEAGFRLVDDKPLMRTNYFLEFIKSGKEKGVE